MKKLVALALALGMTAAVICGCSDPAAQSSEAAKQEAEAAAEAVEEVAEPAEEAAPAAAEEGAVALKDDPERAAAEIETALRAKLDEMYGGKYDEAVITIDKIYNTEEGSSFEPVAEMNLGPDEVAFEAHIDIKPSEGADPNEFLIPNGELDAESGWVKNMGRLGVLRPTGSDPAYTITDFGTGW